MLSRSGNSGYPSLVLDLRWEVITILLLNTKLAVGFHTFFL